MVRIEGLVKRFPAERGEVRAVDGISFTAPAGKFFTLLGPSGCGKTTTLRCIAGLERPEEGEVWLGDVLVSSVRRRVFTPPNRRAMGMVFQSYAIWPHMNVFGNVAFPLQVGDRLSRRAIASRVKDVLHMVQLDGLEDRPATKLSGGQQQRLALARALIRGPQVLLLDEPLSNLDAKLREQMRVELKILQREMGITTIYVTHDQVEALALSDIVAVMHEGKILQIGTPREIYERPANPFVAGFIGMANTLSGRVVTASDASGEVQTPCGSLRCALPAGMRAGDEVLVCLRPEQIEVSAVAPDGGNVWEGKVEQAMFLGDTIDGHISVSGQRLRVKIHPSRTLQVDSRVYLVISPERCVVIPH